MNARIKNVILILDDAIYIHIAGVTRVPNVLTIKHQQSGKYQKLPAISFEIYPKSHSV